VNWSAGVSAEVAGPVVTVMSTVPETGLPNGPTPGGLTAVSSVPETNVTPAAGVVPKSTVEPLVKPLPVIVTTVPYTFHKENRQ